MSGFAKFVKENEEETRALDDEVSRLMTGGDMTAVGAPAPGLLTLDEYLAVASRWIEETAGTPAEAVAYLGVADLEPEAIEQMARIGAQHLLADMEHAHRGEVAAAARGEREAVPGEHQKDRMASVLAMLTYRGADGRLRKLLDFSREDWDAFAATSTIHAAAWRRRVGLSKAALGLLDTFHVETTKELPIDALHELEEKAARAW
jgi:hypothetical protein